MPWFKVDDTLATHPKARTAGLPAMGLWVVAGAYASQHLTEGFVPDWYVATWPGGRKHAAALVAVHLWEPADGGWKFHQWEERQPTKEQVEADRAANRERQRKYRESRRDKTVSNGRSNAVTNGTPTIPDPTINKNTSPDGDASDDVPPVEPRDDVERVCRHLADRMAGNGYNRPAITTRWRESARLLLDRDGRTEQQVIAAIDYAHDSDFWRANIKSIPKLRAQYDTLRLQAMRDRSGPPQDPVDLARERGIPEAWV